MKEVWSFWDRYKIVAAKKISQKRRNIFMAVACHFSKASSSYFLYYNSKHALSNKKLTFFCRLGKYDSSFRIHFICKLIVEKSCGQNKRKMQHTTIQGKIVYHELEKLQSLCLRNRSIAVSLHLVVIFVVHKFH